MKKNWFNRPSMTATALAWLIMVLLVALAAARAWGAEPYPGYVLKITPHGDSVLVQCDECTVILKAFKAPWETVGAKEPYLALSRFSMALKPAVVGLGEFRPEYSTRLGLGYRVNSHLNLGLEKIWVYGSRPNRVELSTKLVP